MNTVCVEDREGGVRILTLDRPPANAENEELLGDLAAALDAARDDEQVRAVVLTGRGRFFGGGMDLGGARRVEEQERLLTDVFRDAHVKLLALPKPTIAMMNGHAIAGGLILVLACDYRLGLDGDYKVGLNEVAIGASYPRVALEIVRLRLPHARAAELMLGAALYPAREALRLGIVDELLPADRLEDTVIRRARRMGAFPREAYADTKAVLLEETLERVRSESGQEASRRMAIWKSDESREARKTQREKLGAKRS